jgi:hypothetical protein
MAGNLRTIFDFLSSFPIELPKKSRGLIENR